MGPDPTSKSQVKPRAPAAIPPLFKADTATLTFAKQADGKIRVNYASWEDAKVVQPGEVFELRWGKQGVEGRIIATLKEPEPDVDPLYIPDEVPDESALKDQEAARDALVVITQSLEIKEQLGGERTPHLDAVSVLADLAGAGFKIVRAQ